MVINAEKKQKIVEYTEEHGRMPTYEELKSILKCKSKEEVHIKVKEMITEGFLVRSEDGIIFPAQKHSNVKKLGTIFAGKFTKSEKYLVGTMNLHDFLISKDKYTFAVSVRSNELLYKGIIEGDTVLVERLKTPEIGDVVVFEKNNEWKLAEYSPRNESFVRKRIEDNGRSAAVVVGVVRKL